MRDTYDWIDVWIGIAVVIVLGFTIFSGVAIAKEHRVDGYYLSHSSSSQTATCVWAHWTWHPDEVAFCTDDKDKALDFAAKANALVK